VAKRSASAQDTRDAGKRLKGVERDLKKLDERKKALETQLAATYAVDPAKELAEVTARIGQLEEEWLALSEIVNA
jgi:predicted translin family RNA/ssDNA-binding protein